MKIKIFLYFHFLKLFFSVFLCMFKIHIFKEEFEENIICIQFLFSKKGFIHVRIDLIILILFCTVTRFEYSRNFLYLYTVVPGIVENHNVVSSAFGPNYSFECNANYFTILVSNMKISLYE